MWQMGFLLVAVGGALGASSRYAVTLLMRPMSGVFPWHTLGVNIVGSFLLGLLMALVPNGDAGERLRLFLGVGVLGGFTTFSSFSVDALTLVQQDQWLTAGVYVLGSMTAALVGAAAGYAAGRAL